MPNLTGSWVGYFTLACFIAAYLLVVLEEKLRLRKSKPVILIGCFMWFLIGLYEALHGGGKARGFVEDLMSEIGGLFFFLLAAMTYINTLDERNVFKCLRSKLLQKGYGFRQLFWATGALAFFISPMADNLTTALLMSTVALAVGHGNPKFIVPAFVNIVVAANAGGAWSPFGDITTLMVWIAGKAHTFEFLYLLAPSLANWLVPALIMLPFVPREKPGASWEEIPLKPGAKIIIGLGILTIATAVSFHQFLHLPPYLGMMFGLGLLMFKGYYLQRQDEKMLPFPGPANNSLPREPFDIFQKIRGVEFDTLLFFFGILTAVGAIQYVGYLALLSHGLYGSLGPTWANILVGTVSSVVDNIPIMYAVLKMDPDMGLDQWLLVTLTTGVGGSLLSIGSAAGVAVMGVDRKHYTFLTHLKWSPAVLAGYVASIAVWRLVTSHLQ
ncbi:MAG: sodium:proton antiporter NhaD [Nitrospinae bacterium]|nr:sodium:proton antiporter NhaD [Nitrospinota bacterium]